MIVVVCGVIHDEAGRVLACQRPAGKQLAGKWEFPGGKMEEGESPELALQRELQEELGIAVGVGAALTPVDWTYDYGSIRLLPYLCRILSGEPRPLEHAALRWCALGDLDQLGWAAADWPIVRELLAANPDCGMR